MQANVEQIEQDIQNFKKQLKIERNLSEHTLRAYDIVTLSFSARIWYVSIHLSIQ